MCIRRAFLETLRAELDDFPRAALDDIIGDLDAHFAEARAAGRSDLQAALRLGDPFWLAGQFRRVAAPDRRLCGQWQD